VSRKSEQRIEKDFNKKRRGKERRERAGGFAPAKGDLHGGEGKLPGSKW